MSMEVAAQGFWSEVTWEYVLPWSEEEFDLLYRWVLRTWRGFCLQSVTTFPGDGIYGLDRICFK
jgi:hypothetical protein